jgi:transposase
METGPAPMRSHGRTDSTKADGFRRLEVITGVGQRRRWTDEEKARIVAESLDPATTASAVARRYGLHASQLFTWRQQLQRHALRAETSGTPGFMPVLMAEDSPAPARAVGRMEIALGPAVVRVGADIDAAALRRVLEAVRGLA